ncbi:MAG: TAXI family TRAP transporter solute-binding subunit, partial [Shewanella sp.]
VIPASTYEGQSADVSTVAIQNLFVTQTGVSDDLAYQMTKLMFEHLDRLGNAHSAAKAIQLDKATKNLPAPLHPGAERYFKEVGAL